MTIAPLLADYIDDRTKGRVSGLTSLMVYVSAFSVTYLNESMDLTKNIALKYYEIAGAAVFIGLAAAIGLKGGRYHKK